MAASDLSDLIGRIALGDRDAFRRLYALTSAKLFGVCLRILSDKSEAEDTLQDSYVKIWRNAAQFGPSQYSPMSWLIAIARNNAIDRLRARKPAPLELDEVSAFSDTELDPEQTAIRADTKRLIENCLGELAEQRAAAVRGAYLDGYSYQEMSEKLGIPLNTIRTWLRRSLIRLRECLER